MATEMTGSLLSVTGTRAWKGGELTNGFLMKNADGRVAAITQSGTLDLTGNQAVTEAAPYGNGLIRLLDDADANAINALRSGADGDSVYQFAGVVKYEAGWAISHPVQNWGIPAFSKFTAISRGIVGYKFSQKSGQSSADYLAFLKGDKSKVTAIDTFDDWMTMLHAATAIGSNLYLIISVTTGFPHVVVGVADKHAVVVEAGHMLIGQAVVFEPENGMIGFELDGDIVYGAVGANEADHYSVVYDDNNATGGTVPVDATAYTPGAAITAAANSGVLVRTGYSFIGWNTAANGSGIGYEAGEAFACGLADLTLYAQWAAEYTVTYNGNGSTGGAVPVEASTFNLGETVTVAANTGVLTLAVHTFGGWNTAANGSGITYPAGATLAMQAANLVLYAVWIAD